MKLSEIRELPTSIDRVHESCYRSYMVVQKVRELCERRCPNDILIELIDDMMNAPNVDKERNNL